MATINLAKFLENDKKCNIHGCSFCSEGYCENESENFMRDLISEICDSINNNELDTCYEFECHFARLKHGYCLCGRRMILDGFNHAFGEENYYTCDCGGD